MRSGLALLPLIVFACGCFNYAPLRNPASPGPVDAALGLPLGNPDAIAVVDKGRDTQTSFTFVDGTGHELTVDELRARYLRVVGHDDVHDTFASNWRAVLLALVGVSVATLSLDVLAIDQCAGSQATFCATSRGKTELVSGTAVTALILGSTVYALTLRADNQAPLTRKQGEDLASRYNKVLRAPNRSAPLAESPRAGVRLVVGPTGIAGTF